MTRGSRVAYIGVEAGCHRQEVLYRDRPFPGIVVGVRRVGWERRNDVNMHPIDEGLRDGDPHKRGGEALGCGADVVEGVAAVAVEVAFEDQATVASDKEAAKVVVRVVADERGYLGHARWVRHAKLLIKRNLTFLSLSSQYSNFIVGLSRCVMHYRCFHLLGKPGEG